MNPSILMKIVTCDQNGNEITTEEKRIYEKKAPPPPGQKQEAVRNIRDYCTLFVSLLVKQEFTPNEVIREFKTFFIETDKSSMS